MVNKPRQNLIQSDEFNKTVCLNTFFGNIIFKTNNLEGKRTLGVRACWEA